MVILGTPIMIKPVEGWGFKETIDGKLASSFEAKITGSGVATDCGILGWRGKAATGKYTGSDLMMTPRHRPWSGHVVLRVRQNSETVFDGIAETKGLRCNWL